MLFPPMPTKFCAPHNRESPFHTYSYRPCRLTWPKLLSMNISSITSTQLWYLIENWSRPALSLNPSANTRPREDIFIPVSKSFGFGWARGRQIRIHRGSRQRWRSLVVLTCRTIIWSGSGKLRFFLWLRLWRFVGAICCRIWGTKKSWHLGILKERSWRGKRLMCRRETSITRAWLVEGGVRDFQGLASNWLKCQTYRSLQAPNEVPLNLASRC